MGTSLWRHRNFLLLWSGQSVSEIGSSVTQLALPLTAVVVLRASTFQVGLLTSAYTAAFALIALPAGALVDRWAKRRLMIWCDVARMVIIGSVPLAAALGVLTLGQLYAVAVTAGVGTVFFDVAYQSYLPEVVDREHLVEGNGKLGATQAFAQVTGPGLGGALTGLVGAARALAADSISYAVSVASLLAMNVREEARPAAGHRPGLRKEIAEGLSFVLRHPVLRKIVACTGTANLFGSMAVSYRQAICPPGLLGRMNAAVRWVVWGTIPVGGVLGGALGTVAGVRPTLWIAYAGCWAAGWWVFFSPLRRQRDFEDQPDPGGPGDPGDPEAPRGPEALRGLEDERAPGSGLPGHGGGKLPDGAGPQLGD